MNTLVRCALFVASVAMLTSCVREVRPVGQDAPVGLDRPAQSAEIGERVQTRDGNAITLFGIESPAVADPSIPRPGNAFAAADVEACAGPRAGVKTGVSPVFFFLETEKEAYAALPPSGRQPALLDTTLAPNRCTRGWITFEVPDHAKLEKVTFHSSSAIEWKVGR